MLAFGEAELPPEPLRAYTPRTIATAGRAGRGAERVRGRGLGGRAGEREDDLAPSPHRSATAAASCRRSSASGAGVALRRAARRAPLLDRAARHCPRRCCGDGGQLGNRRRPAPAGRLMQRWPALAGRRCERTPDRRTGAVRGLTQAARPGTPRARGSCFAGSFGVGAPLEPCRGRGRRPAGPGALGTSLRSASIGSRAAEARSRSTSTASQDRQRRRRAERVLDLLAGPGALPYFIAQRTAWSATSATLTMIRRWPDSTAASIASSVAAGSKGTSNVTSITGRLPATAGMSALVRVRRIPSTGYRGCSFQLFVLSRMRFDAQGAGSAAPRGGRTPSTSMKRQEGVSSPCVCRHFVARRRCWSSSTRGRSPACAAVSCARCRSGRTRSSVASRAPHDLDRPDVRAAGVLRPAGIQLPVAVGLLAARRGRFGVRRTQRAGRDRAAWHLPHRQGRRRALVGRQRHPGRRDIDDYKKAIAAL